ncbi:PE family protein, partial [Mycobacterium tuberculosis]
MGQRWGRRLGRARPSRRIVTPETVAAAASDVARIGSSIGAANAAAAG